MRDRQHRKICHRFSLRYTCDNIVDAQVSLRMHSRELIAAGHDCGCSRIGACIGETDHQPAIVILSYAANATITFIR